MRRSITLTALVAIFSVAFAACTTTTENTPNKPPVNAVPTASPAASPASSPEKGNTDDKNGSDEKVESLVGRWSGPEGSYVNITEKDDKFAIVLANLDGPKTYEGTAKGSVIEFTRNGKTETITAATGEETGMKYLLDEKNCVVITKGSEGFCKK